MTAESEGVDAKLQQNAYQPWRRPQFLEEPEVSKMWIEISWIMSGRQVLSDWVLKVDGGKTVGV